MIIYCAINKINGKKYVGQSTLTLDERRKSHLHDCKYKDYVFGRAINKYGIDAFEWEILYTCSSIDEMIEKEKQFIALYDLYNSGKGYNASPGGEFQTQERRKSISESLSKSLMGHKLSEETKRKISRSRMGQKRSVESRLKQGLTNHGRDSWWKGKKLSKKHKLNIKMGSIGKKKPGTSIAMKKRWQLYRKQLLENNI